MPDHESRHRVLVIDWRLLVFSGFFLPVLLALGIWQLDRAAEKQALLAQWSDPVQARPWTGLEPEKLVVGQPVTMAGHYSTLNWLLDNRTRDGVPGYEVLTLFFPDEGRPVVVNRGWIAGTSRREQLPEFSTPADPVRLRGRISDYPEPPVLSTGPVAEGWPRRVQSLPRARAAEVEQSVPGYILQLENGNQPGAFRADWEPDMMGPQTHYGYALQWFSLAVALIILTIIASYRKQES